jgi:nitrogen regulatory protein PII
MKFITGIIYTRDLQKVAEALKAMGLIVHQITSGGRGTLHHGVTDGLAIVHHVFNRVKIRTMIRDELVGTMLDALHSFGNCRFVITPEEHCTCAP